MKPDEVEVTWRTLVGAVVLTALISSVVTALIVIAVVGGGKTGPPGAQGLRGATGKSTSADVTSEAVAQAISDDPAAITAALGGGSATDVAGRISDLRSRVSALETQVSTLCESAGTTAATTTDAAAVPVC